jgi:hypothetical protein
MNKKQKLALWAGLGTFCLTLLFAPWQVTPPPDQHTDLLSGAHYSTPRSTYSVNGPIWDAPFNGELMIGVLLMEWVGIGVCSMILLFALRDGRKKLDGAPNVPPKL